MSRSGSSRTQLRSHGRAAAIATRDDPAAGLVLADAILTQRELSLQVLEAGGDYVWIIKDNQPKTQVDIQRLCIYETF